MMKKKYLALILIGLLAACGINSVTTQQLQNVKAGDVVVYRFSKAADSDKTWFYADKITRVEGNTLYYNPGKMEATAGNDDRLYNFDTSQELSISRDELVKYATEQGADKKVIIWIK